jgi:hypothetical protein
MEDTTLMHGAALDAVRVRTTEPFAISPLLWKYTGFWILGLLNVPVPEVVQTRPVYKDAEADESKIEVWVEHITSSCPASARA